MPEIRSSQNTQWRSSTLSQGCTRPRILPADRSESGAITIGGFLPQQFSNWYSEEISDRTHLLLPESSGLSASIARVVVASGVMGVAVFSQGQLEPPPAEYPAKVLVVCSWASENPHVWHALPEATLTDKQLAESSDIDSVEAFAAMNQDSINHDERIRAIEARDDDLWMFTRDDV